MIKLFLILSLSFFCVFFAFAEIQTFSIEPQQNSKQINLPQNQNSTDKTATPNEKTTAINQLQNTESKTSGQNMQNNGQNQQTGTQNQIESNATSLNEKNDDAQNQNNAQGIYQNLQNNDSQTGNSQQQEIPYKELELSYPKDNELYLKFFNQYNSEYGKKWLTAVMKNATPYRSYIQNKIKEMGLPECLEFLPVIESSFKINATSKSGAKGLWQFMKNSIAPYMKITDWYDQRCDPWISTDSALKKLKENYDELGDWYLALAAYNTGLGGIKRTIKRYNSNDYWELSKKKALKNETAQYVPKFLAIAELLTNAEYYQIEIPEAEPNNFDSYAFVETKRNLDISLIAEEVGIEQDLMSFLNPALTYGVTPPDSSYNLRVPQEHKESIEALIKDQSKLLIKYHRYKIRSGDTLFALSLHYDVSVDMILQANPGLKANSLQIGKTVLIPAFKEVKPYTSKKKNDKVVYNGKYTVQKGETLWSISLKYDVQVEDLAEANNMQVDSILRIGSTLKVPIIE